MNTHLLHFWSLSLLYPSFINSVCFPLSLWLCLNPLPSLPEFWHHVPETLINERSRHVQSLPDTGDLWIARQRQQCEQFSFYLSLFHTHTQSVLKGAFLFLSFLKSEPNIANMKYSKGLNSQKYKSIQRQSVCLTFFSLNWLLPGWLNTSVKTTMVL